MSWYRHLVLPLLVCLLVVFAGAVAQQNAPPPKSKDSKDPAQLVPKGPPPKADARATELLDAAIKKLDPKETPWIKTEMWLRVETNALVFVATGKYRTGPDYRLHLDLAVQIGETKSELLAVCDGKKFWLREYSGPKNSSRYMVDMSKVIADLNHKDLASELREEFLVGQSFGGVTPLLKNLRKQLTFVRWEETKWKERPVIKLTGVWTKAGDMPVEQWPAYQVRECRLYLDPNNHYWPVRIEWLGPKLQRAPKKDDVVLTEMEFRDPELFTKQPDWKFTFDPGTDTYDDRTTEWHNLIGAMAMQMADQKKTQPNVKPPTKSEKK